VFKIANNEILRLPLDRDCEIEELLNILWFKYIFIRLKSKFTRVLLLVKYLGVIDKALPVVVFIKLVKFCTQLSTKTLHAN